MIGRWLFTEELRAVLERSGARGERLVHAAMRGSRSAAEELRRMMTSATTQADGVP